MINLFEDFKNLNIIDRSFLELGRRYNKVNMGNNMPITPESEIVVSRVEPHKFSTILELLNNNDDIAGVVVRAHNRQLIFVTANRNTIRNMGGGYSNYLGVLSYNAYKNYNDHGYDRLIRTDAEAPIKTAISRTVKSFYDKMASTVKKKWDVLIIYKDKNVEDKRNQRSEYQSGRVLTPKEAGYDEYINKLNAAFQKRAEAYIDSLRPNTTNANELKEFLLSRLKINKIKFKGKTYVLYNTDMGYPESLFCYKLENNNSDNEATLIYVKIELKGLKPEIIDVRVTPDRYGSYRWANSIM